MIWDQWIRERITWNGLEVLPRSTCIRRFVEEGLVRLLTQKGYTLAVSPKVLANQIANGLYDSCGKSCIGNSWNTVNRNTACKIEDVWHWSFVLDDEVWDTFWQTWGNWEDVSLDSYRGQDRRIDIRWHIWSQIDLQRSRAWLEHNEEEGGAESPKEVRGRGEDSYLREATESGQYDGWRR